jgi:branched-chain amino acid transport system substrate-binding protein
VQELYVPLGPTDFAPYVAKIDRSASLVFASFSGTDAPHFLQAFRDAGIRAPLVGHGALTDEVLLRSEGANASGVITTLQYSSTLPSQANTTFRLRYEGLTHRPVSRYVEDGYVAAQALDAGLARLGPGPVRGESLASALRGVSFDAPRGRFRFDDRHAAVVDIYVRRVREFGGRMRNSIVSVYPAVSQFWRYDPARYLEFKPYADLKGTWARGPAVSTPPPLASPAPVPEATR